VDTAIPNGEGKAPAEMADRNDEDRTWSRLQRNVVIGAGVGAVVGIAVGLIVGAIAFQRSGAIAASALAGAIGLGVLGAFWGVLGSLESPEPGNEPGDVDEPLRDVHELTGEQRPLRQTSEPPSRDADH
jgi:hypothetical protein